MMKAIICTKYGSPDVLQLQEVAKPDPQDDEVLIKIHAASINSRDWRFMRAKPFFIRLLPGGLLRPKNKILGGDLAGNVEAVGRSVRHFKPGDEVFGYLPSSTSRGTLAEYVCADEAALTPKPANLNFEKAASVPLAAMTALQGLRDDGHLQRGQKVLIHGASGGVGTFALQIAKALGAEVTAVCSIRNVELVRSLGAKHVIDYKSEDFTKKWRNFDLILAVNGNRPIADYLEVLKPAGTLVVIGGSIKQLIQAGQSKKRASNRQGKQIRITELRQDQKDLLFLKELLETAKVKPIIDGIYPLDQTADAFRYYEEMHPKGKVVIRIDN
jgi:NADPH:quinone reductase-like Zn-dependent oxidoreductase